MKSKVICIFCQKRFTPNLSSSGGFLLHICPRCQKLEKINQDKLTLPTDVRAKLLKEAEAYIKQAMTGHTCGGPHELCFSSSCKGCCPGTTQHYGEAADMIIAWAGNYWRQKIMQDWLIKEKLRKKTTK